MSETQLETGRSWRSGLMPDTRVVLLALLGVGFVTASLSLSLTTLGTPLLYVGTGILTAAIWVFGSSAMQVRSRIALGRAVAGFVEADHVPSVVTNIEGQVIALNPAAQNQFGDAVGRPLIELMGAALASPGPLMRRLQDLAEESGKACETVTLRKGQLRLAVHKIGPGSFLWRYEETTDARLADRAGDGIEIPMLTVSSVGRVLYMNEPMHDLVGQQKTLDRIIEDLPVRPNDAHRVATQDGTRRLTVVDVSRSPTRHDYYFLPAEPSMNLVDWDLVDPLPVPLLMMSRRGEVRMANRMARDVLSIAPGEKPMFGELIEGLGRPLLDWIAEVADQRGAGRPEFVRPARTTKDIYIQTTLSRFQRDGEVGVVAVLNDATELKTLEAQFVQSQKMQAIGQLAGGVAHDFNNLLTAISGHCDLLLLRRDPGDPDYADLEQINQNANRAAALVGQLLAFSRKQNLRPEQLDLRETMGELTHLLNRLVGEKITLSLTYQDEDKKIRADRRQFEQIMMNLVVNARDAMPDGGVIEVESRLEAIVEGVERDRAVIPPGDYVVVEVRDHGIGIPSENLAKIFEPFFTTKRSGEGTGLGLSTVYGIVKQSGGFIFAESHVGEGTTFSLLFPAQDAETVAIERKSQTNTRRRQTAGGVVLLVEDEAPVRAFASRALQLRGYTVIEAANAEEALERLSDASLNVDVFVTDVIMPGMDGPTWVAEALKKRPETRVIFVSGYAEESFSEEQARIPDSVFLPKPFSLVELTETVQAQLH